MSRTAMSTKSTDLKGLVVKRRFSSPGTHPFDEIEWEIRDAVIGNPESPAFEQRGVEFPKSWSQNSTNIVAQKYFRGQLGSPERESSVKQMIGRVAGTISGWGREGGYFASAEDADAFEAFEETGNAFDPATAKRLREDIYSAGNLRDPAEAYIAFRGRLPAVDALLKKRGLDHAVPA